MLRRRLVNFPAQTNYAKERCSRDFYNYIFRTHVPFRHSNFKGHVQDEVDDGYKSGWKLNDIAGGTGGGQAFRWQAVETFYTTPRSDLFLIYCVRDLRYFFSPFSYEK